MKKILFGCVIAAMLIAASVVFVGVRQKAAADTLTCHQVQGYLTAQVVSSSPLETQGTLTQASRLNGTTQDQFTTINSTGTTYTATFQDTTENGTLVTQDKGQLSASNGIITFTENGTVDANASTGGFAGGSGSLTFSGSSTDGGATFTATVTGQICQTGS